MDVKHFKKEDLFSVSESLTESNIKELIDNRMILIDVVDEVLNEEYGIITKDESKVCDSNF